jgi:hypothetical protein
MWRLAKSVMAGVTLLALVAFAFWLWLQQKIASLGGGYFEFAPDKPRLIAITFLIFATGFFLQWRRSQKG